MGKRVASCSFGKDSLVAIDAEMESGGIIDEALYCRVMFDDETSAEFPEHEEWIYEHAIPLLKSRYGIKTTIIQDTFNYCECFYRVFEEGKNVGRIYGFPFLKGPWCNSRLKMAPINRWKTQAGGDCTFVVGIEADEEMRSHKKTVRNKALPLVAQGITKDKVFEIARNRDLLSPAYGEDRDRLGCWFCHNQKVGELRKLRAMHPELWKKLLALDADSPVTFKAPSRGQCRGCTVRDFDERFRMEDIKLIAADDKVFRWSMQEDDGLNYRLF